MRRASAWCRVGVVLLVAALAVGPAQATGTLHWRTDRRLVDADIDGWPLATLLEEMAGQTGWQIYAEPALTHTVATRFERLGTVEALDRLLNGLSYALLPQDTGPAKLIVYRSSADRATERIRARARRSGAAQPIADERIVRLKNGADIDRLARRLGATIVARLDAVGAYRLRFDDAAAAAAAERRMGDDPEVESVETNQSIGAPAVLEPLAASGQGPRMLVPDVSPSADKVIVGLIDTAVQTGDPWLQQFVQPGLALNGAVTPPADQLTHGTAMASTILDGVARALAERGDTSGTAALSILPIDVYGPQERTDTFSVAQGLYEALARHANVINLSLAGDTDSALVRELTQLAARHGVVVVAAAGNEPIATQTYPAADPGVLSVTASDLTGRRAPYANAGAWVDLMAPGENVLHYQGRAWYGTGTSVATGWVSGWAGGFLVSRGADRSAVTQETLGRWRLP